MSEKLFYNINAREEAESAGPTQLEIGYGNTLASVSPEVGGMVTKFSVSGKDVLYFDLDAFRGGKHKPKVGVPVLMPFSGADPDKKVRQHGGLREIPWVWEDRDEHSVTLSLDTANITNKELVSELYEKFGAELDFTYEIKVSTGENSLGYDIKIKNNGSEDMHTAPGLHPYFKVSPEQQSKIKSNIPNLNLSGKTWGPDEEAIITTRPENEDAWFTIPGIGKITITTSDAFDTFVVWSKQNEAGEREGYLCIEPWVGEPGTITDTEKRLTIAPGEEIQLSVLFAVESE